MKFQVGDKVRLLAPVNAWAPGMQSITIYAGSICVIVAHTIGGAAIVDVEGYQASVQLNDLAEVRNRAAPQKVVQP